MAPRDRPAPALAAESARKEGEGVSVKICGVRTASALEAAISGGARWAGFVRYGPSPRFVSLEALGSLVETARARVEPVVLLVNPGDDELDALLGAVRAETLQLAGDETPGRVAEVRARTGCRVIKSIAIADRSDLARARAHAETADRLLLDAPAPPGGLPGGNAVCFDWSLLEGAEFLRPSGLACPWLLAGGLTAENVAAAVSASGARAVDVSSGVESERGEKSPAKISAFLRAARNLTRPPDDSQARASLDQKAAFMQ